MSTTTKNKKQSGAPKNAKRQANSAIDTNANNASQIYDDPDAAILTSDDCTSYRSTNGFSQYTTVGKFARIKYGDNQELLFNINCQIQLIMDYINNRCREVIQEAGNVNIDLIDLDGNIKFISDRSLKTKLASDILQPRKMYILVDLKQTTVDNKQLNQVTPLLRNSDLLNSSFMNKLAQKPGVIGATTNSKVSARSTSRLSNSIIKNVLGSTSNLNQSAVPASSLSGKPNLASTAKSAMKMANKK